MIFFIFPFCIRGLNMQIMISNGRFENLIIGLFFFVFPIKICFTTNIYIYKTSSFFFFFIFFLFLLFSFFFFPLLLLLLHSFSLDLGQTERQDAPVFFFLFIYFLFLPFFFLCFFFNFFYPSGFLFARKKAGDAPQIFSLLSVSLSFSSPFFSFSSPLSFSLSLALFSLDQRKEGHLQSRFHLVILGDSPSSFLAWASSRVTLSSVLSVILDFACLVVSSDQSKRGFCNFLAEEAFTLKILSFFFLTRTKR